MIPEHFSSVSGEIITDINGRIYRKITVVLEDSEFYCDWSDWPSTPAYVIHTKQQIIDEQQKHIEQTRSEIEALHRELKALRSDKENERIKQQTELNRLQCQIAQIQAANVQLATGGVPLGYAMERALSVNGTHQEAAYDHAPAY